MRAVELADQRLRLAVVQRLESFRLKFVHSSAPVEDVEKLVEDLQARVNAWDAETGVGGSAS